MRHSSNLVPSLQSHRLSTPPESRQLSRWTGACLGTRDRALCGAPPVHDELTFDGMHDSTPDDPHYPRNGPSVSSLGRGPSYPNSSQLIPSDPSDQFGTGVCWPVACMPRIVTFSHQLDCSLGIARSLPFPAPPPVPFQTFPFHPHAMRGQGWTRMA